MSGSRIWVSACLFAGGAIASTASAISMELVAVGNPGNAADTRYNGIAVGSVAYTYDIGKYEVTAGQYSEFLNAVAKTDTYGLYSTLMWDPHPRYGDTGCKIQRGGPSGSFTYSVALDWANRPVNHVSWGDAARFANWMHNGQPTGLQDLSTTENGSYDLNGAMTNEALWAVRRSANATWVIPSEDEWYKAAYHKNDGVTGNYWDYPTGTDAAPNNGNPGGDTGNSANFYDGDYAIGSPYWRTPVGYFANSASPYGTFDQGGNVWEWDEAVLVGYGPFRYGRGGSFLNDAIVLRATARDSGLIWPTLETADTGFRVVAVPEPGCLAVLGLGGLLWTRRRGPRGHAI